jgi:Tfp pilus assembly protein PilF
MAAAAVYAHTLNAPFYFDDVPNIVENPAVHLTQLNIENIRRAATESRLENRPLAYLSFAINFYLGGFDPAGYHLVNVFFHLATASLLFLVIHATLGQADFEPRRHRAAIAFFAALIWAVHPIQTQAVTYIVQRMTAMTGAFYLLCLWLYIKGRRSGATAGRICWWTGAVLSGLAALVSKEIALTLPVFILLYEWFFFQNARLQWLRRAKVPLLLAAVGLLLVVLMYTNFHPIRSLLGSYGDREFTLGQRMLTQSRVVVFYLSLILLPLPGRLSLLHSVPISTGLVTPVSTLVCIALLLALIGLAFWLIFRDRLSAFALLWFFGGLVVESSALGLELIYEHRLYLPTMFLGVAFFCLLQRLFGPRSRGAAFVVMGALCIVMGYWTVERNRLWNDPVAFWTHTAVKAPDDARPRGQLAAALMRRGELQEAVVQLKHTLALDETLLDAYLNLAGISAWLGDEETAVDAYNKAIEIHGEAPRILVPFAAFYLRRGKYDTAEFLLQRGLANAPDHALLLNRLGRLYQEQKKPDEARKMFERAIAADSGFADAYDNLGQVLFGQGRTSEAVAALEQAVRLDPANAGRNYNLAYAYEKMGRFEEAAVQYERVLKIDPKDADVLYRTGFLLAGKLGRVQEGMELLRAAVKAAPEDSRAQTAKMVVGQ